MTNKRIAKKQKRSVGKTPIYLPGSAGLMYVPPGQLQGTLGQPFYGSSLQNIPVGESALFSPGIPLPQQPGVNPGGYPVQFKFPVAVNTFPVDRTLGNQDIPSFQQLRMLAKLYNGITLCERAWFDMVPRMQLQIHLKPEYLAAGAEEKDYQAEIAYFMNWLESPDKIHDLHSWLRIALREQTQIDELYIYKRKQRNGYLYALEIHSGDQFKPLLDDWGRPPKPPAYAYQQYPWGLPGAWFTSDEMIHYQESPAADNPYGQSRVERIIMLVNQALRKQKKDLAHFTEGNIPQGLMMVPESAVWTPDQIDAFEQAWNALLAGNASQQVRIRFTQPGMQYKAFEQYSLDPTFDKFLLNVSVSAYGLSMQDVAFTEDIHKSSGDSQQNVTYRRTIDPLATVYSAMLTNVVNTEFPPDMRGDMFQVTFGGYDEEEDVSELATAYTDLVKTGILGVTNAGKLMKLPDDPKAPYIGRVVMTKDGPIFLDDIATDKVRNAQLQAQLAGYKQAATGQPNQKQTPSDANQTSVTKQQSENSNDIDMSNLDTTSGINQQLRTIISMLQKSDIALQRADVTPQQAQVNQGIVTSAEENDLTGNAGNPGASASEEDSNDTTDYSSLEESEDGSEPGDITNLEDEEENEQDEESEDLGDEEEDFEDEFGLTDEERQQENEIALLLSQEQDEPFSELERTVEQIFEEEQLEIVALERHYPGGKDHDQKTHGDWAHPGYGEGASKPNPTAGGGGGGTYVSPQTNAKIIAASKGVQTAAADFLKARQNLANSQYGTPQRTAAREAMAIARQEMHDARLALELYRQQARKEIAAARAQIRQQRASERAKLREERLKAREARLKARVARAKAKARNKAKLQAEKEKLHLQKIAAAAKVKAERMAMKAQLKAQRAAAKSAKSAAKSSKSGVHGLKSAVTTLKAGRQLQNLVNTISSKAILYNALAARPNGRHWTQQDAAEALQISHDLKSLADAVNTHQNEEDVTGLVNSLNTAISEMQGQRIGGSKIKSGIGKAGAATAQTSYMTPGRTSVLEKLSTKSQAAVSRSQEGINYESDELQETIDPTLAIFELYIQQIEEKESIEKDGENLERSEESTMVERAIGRSAETEGKQRLIQKEISAEYRRWRARSIEDVKLKRNQRGFTTVLIPSQIHAWISQQLTLCETVDDVRQTFERAKEVEQTSVLFIDVDGVLSITNAGIESKEIDGKEAWPIPHAITFLEALHSAEYVQPVWMTHWGKKANGWNDKAKISHWDVAFPLSEEQVKIAKEKHHKFDRKLLAIQYYLSSHPALHIGWIQDGFSPEERLWAETHDMLLIDTTQEPLHSLLLSTNSSDVAKVVDLILDSLSEKNGI